MKPAGRLIISDPLAGPENMSLDQAMLESTQQTGTPVLRFYRWTPATLSLGYFQKAADRKLQAASLDCPIIRRASGGGAIVHDDELTYSICIRTSGSIAKANEGLYDTVHQSICKALASQDFAVSLYPEVTSASRSDPFLCFQRRAKGDIICGTDKVGGSAQRRLKNALIQHGSLLLSQSQFAPELPGLKELCGHRVNVGTLIAEIVQELASRTGMEFEPSEPSQGEQQRAAEISAEKFASESWLNKR